MKISRLSLKKVNNIERQIKLYKKDHQKIVHEENETKLMNDEYGFSSYTTLRDFYEFYVDGQSLINIISKNYWENEADEDCKLFDTHVGCIGSFGAISDEIYCRALTQKKYTKEEKEILINKHGSNISKWFVDAIEEDFLFYWCQSCADSGCGGISMDIIRKDNIITWKDHEKITIHFDLTEYEKVLEDYLNSQNE